MTFDEFLETLDPANPNYAGVCQMLRDLSTNNLRLARKSRDLVKVVARLIEDGFPPIIDKKLQVVIGVSAHRWPRAELYRYHACLPPIVRVPGDPEAWHQQNSDDADAWSYGGMGYYFSTAGIPGVPRRPVIKDDYRPDHFDRDLFSVYGVET